MRDNAIEHVYICTHPECPKQLPLIATAEGLKCPHGHFFPYATGTEIPIFASQSSGINEYSIEDSAKIHDNALAWLFNTFQTEESVLRNKLISRLSLEKGQRILITGAGAGNDIPFIIGALEASGEIFAQDISGEMLLAAAQRYQNSNSSEIQIHFNISDATCLPFTDDFFDAAYHFGGINLFPNVRAGILEMDRVVRSGGKVVIGDEGIAPWLAKTEYANMLIKNNYLYSFSAPVADIPPLARDVKLSWELSNTFWVIQFTVSNSPLPFSMDVPHVGRRGGSIRTRYWGQLEGIDPELRNTLYATAEANSMSRVELLEKILRDGIKQY